MNAKRIRNGRRLTALLLCLLLMLSGAPLQALAAEAQTDVVTCTDPTNADVAITYDYDTQTLTVSGSGRFSGQVLGADGSTAVNMLDAFSVSRSGRCYRIFDCRQRNEYHLFAGQLDCRKL